MYKRPKKQSNKYKRSKHIRSAWTVGLILVSLVTWTSVISNLTKLNAFSVQKVIVKGADPDIATSLQAAALGALEGDYWHIFSRANSLLISKSAIAEAVAHASQRVDKVSVSRDGLETLVVNVEEKSPAALVCDNLPNWNGQALTLESDDCSFADATGIVYKKAPAVSGHMYNRYYSSSPISDFAALQKFYNDIRLHGFDVLGVLVKPGGEYELYVSNLGLDTTAVIYFNKHNGFDKELSNLVSFWNNTRDRDFDSIDLRYGSNVFFRLN